MIGIELQKNVKVRKVLEIINRQIIMNINNKVSGKIIINFFEGGITSWKTEKTFKPEK
jgi:hypothetical protein